MIDVKETLNSAAERMEMAAMYLAEELSHIRAGRANVAILDGVRVNSYGSMVPLNQVATVTTPDARTIAIRARCVIGADGFLGGCLYAWSVHEPELLNVLGWQELAITGGSVFLFGLIITALCANISVNKFLKMKAGDLYKI